MPGIVFSVPSKMKDAACVVRVMITMVLACTIAVFAGNALDEIFHTSPLLLLVLLAYAIASSLYMMIRKLGDEQ